MWKRSAHVTKGLEVLTTLPDSPERTQQELALHLTLGPGVLGEYQGPSHPRSGTRLCPGLRAGRQVGDTRQLFPALWGLYYVHQVRGQLQRAREVGEELLGLAQQLQDPLLSLEAHRALGNSLFWRGELELARTHVTHVLALDMTRSRCVTTPSATARTLASPAASLAP